MLETLAPPIALAAFGGIARACRRGARSWRGFCGSMVVSGFSGVVVHLLIRESSLSASLQAAIVAVSGYSGGAVLDAFASTLVNKIGILPEYGKNKGENNG